jgi:hypothetical protein
MSSSIEAPLRVVLVCEFYPPYASEAAESVQRLAHGIACAGVELVVAACTALGAPPLTASASGNPRVYRVSGAAEAFVLLDLEEAHRPFDVMHAIGVRMTVRCARAPSRGTRGTRPLVVSLGAECDLKDLKDDRAVRLLGRASWVAPASSELHERLMRRASELNETPAASVIAPEDGESFAALYARLAGGDGDMRGAAETALPVENA